MHFSLKNEKKCWTILLCIRVKRSMHSFFAYAGKSLAVLEIFIDLYYNTVFGSLKLNGYKLLNLSSFTLHLCGFKSQC